MRWEERTMSLPKTKTETAVFDIKALLARLEAAEQVHEYAAHDNGCILTFWEAGRPTPGGGYETKIAGKWYQFRPVNEEPKCDCGLDEALEAWRKAAGK
jgi:hypothetical protein